MENPKRHMGKIKEWLMDIEHHAESARVARMPEDDAITYIKEHLDPRYQDTSRNTLLEVYRSVIQRAEQGSKHYNVYE